MGIFHFENSLGRGGLVRASRTIMTSKNTMHNVRIRDDICERLCPSTVREKLRFTSGGIVDPSVRINQFVGHTICDSRRFNNRMVLSQNGTVERVKYFLMTSGTSDTPHAHRFCCSY